MGPETRILLAFAAPGSARYAPTFRSAHGKLSKARRYGISRVQPLASRKRTSKTGSHMRNFRASPRRAELLTATGLLFPLSASAHGQSVSPLGARGFTVTPPPQSVKLGAQDFPFGGSRRLELAPDVPASDIAVQTLKESLQSRFRPDASRGREGRRGQHFASGD